MKYALSIIISRAGLPGGCVEQGGVNAASVAHRGPFRNLIHQLVIRQRPMTGRTVPSGMVQSYADEFESLLPVSAAEQDTGHYFPGINTVRPRRAGSVFASDAIASLIERSSQRRPWSGTGRRGALAKDPVIELIEFKRARAFEPGPVRSPIGSMPHPPITATTTAAFESPDLTSQPDTAHENRWGFGHPLWPAPWKPLDKAPTSL